MDIENFLETYGPLVIVLALTAAGIILTRMWIHRRRTFDQGHIHIREQLIVIGLALIAAIAVVLALPIHESDRNSLLGILGLVITAVIGLSATTHVGNALAGILIRSGRRFRPGDFIHSGDHFGRVTDLGLFHTEIQTEMRDLTILPNLRLATEPLTVVRSTGTIAAATVSLGYDAPRGEITAALTAAATEVGLSEPVVQVRELGDFSVTYRVAGLLTEPRRLLSARSDLRKAMLDQLHGAGIEIVSPTFMNQRQLTPSSSTIPRDAAAEAIEVNDFESLVFDKADLAESVEELTDRITDIDARIAELQAAEPTPETSRLRESLEQSKAVITRVVEDRKKAVEEDGRR
jgi:small-conductance mechanosensitive channel